MVQGVIRECLQTLAVPYLLVSPATLKKFATNKGNAKKPEMRKAWLEYAGFDVADDNKVDAAWLRTIGHYFAYDWPTLLPSYPEHFDIATEKLRPAWREVEDVLKLTSSTYV